MFDYNNFVSGEIRQLAFRKSNEQATWPEAVRQRVADSETCQGKYASNSFLAHFARALIFQYSQWRRAQHPSSGLMNSIPSRHKAG